MPQASARPLDSFALDEIPGFSALTVQQRCDFLRRYHVSRAQAHKAFQRAESQEQREQVIRNLQVCAETLTVETIRAIAATYCSVANERVAKSRAAQLRLLK